MAIVRREVDGWRARKVPSRAVVTEHAVWRHLPMRTLIRAVIKQLIQHLDISCRRRAVNGRQGAQEFAKFGIAALPALFNGGLPQDVTLVVHASVLVGKFDLGDGGATAKGALGVVFRLSAKRRRGLCLCRGLGARLE